MLVVGILEHMEVLAHHLQRKGVLQSIVDFPRAVQVICNIEVILLPVECNQLRPHEAEEILVVDGLE